MTFAELGLTARASLGTTADIDERGLVVGFGLAETVSSSGGVGGKYSKLGESKSRAEEAIELIHTRGGWGYGSPKLRCVLICAREQEVRLASVAYFHDELSSLKGQTDDIIWP